MFNFETDKKFLMCDMNDVTIPHALYCVLRHQFQRGVILQCGDPEHRITLCEINSI